MQRSVPSTLPSPFRGKFDRGKLYWRGLSRAATIEEYVMDRSKDGKERMLDSGYPPKPKLYAFTFKRGIPTFHRAMRAKSETIFRCCPAFLASRVGNAGGDCSGIPPKAIVEGNAGGVLFAAACALPALRRAATGPEWKLVSTVAFLRWTWLNCHAIERWESIGRSARSARVLLPASLLGLVGARLPIWSRSPRLLCNCDEPTYRSHPPAKFPLMLHLC
jgi:hypothetical protein